MLTFRNKQYNLYVSQSVSIRSNMCLCFCQNSMFLSINSRLCHIHSVYVTDCLCLSKIVFVCHTQPLSQIVCVCHRQSVSATQSLCLLHIICVFFIDNICPSHPVCVFHNNSSLMFFASIFTLCYAIFVQICPWVWIFLIALTAMTTLWTPGSGTP